MVYNFCNQMKVAPPTEKSANESPIISFVI